MSTTYTIEDGNWNGAEIWAWTDNEGTQIGRAFFTNLISDPDHRAAVQLDNGRVGDNFTSPEAILAWVAENA